MHSYYESNKWKYIRNQAKMLAGHRCQVCNASGRLEVHHRTYSRFENENISDLVVLCPGCHGLYHTRMPEVPAVVQLDLPMSASANDD